ncbi:MAG: biotin--[acetyl-CoA-carboxylase] ligase [Candidatus Omnitrophota bacterium]|nr:biotin--[acetyl-CoA-carboxylase] ligase [Candidatus Omnitrophota bacterium]
MRFKIEHFKSLDSTNTLVSQYAREGRPEGTVVVADYQKFGRGRFGRKWYSKRNENLLFSVLVRPPVTAAKAPMLTQIACRSVAKILKKHYRLHPTLKRPNDLLIKGKKICGILVEASSSAGQLQSAVIGIGLNVGAAPQSLRKRSTSMFAERGQQYRIQPLLKRILSQLREDLAPLYAHTP